MLPCFTVEDVKTERSRVYVRARIVTAQDFAVTDGSKLGGARVSAKEFSEPQLGVFLFRLENVSDAETFRVGDTVELESP